MRIERKGGQNRLRRIRQDGEDGCVLRQRRNARGAGVTLGASDTWVSRVLRGGYLVSFLPPVLTQERVPEAGAAGPGPLPCLNINNCTDSPLADGVNRLSSGHRKTAFALKENVERLAKKYGIERLGFLTLTFADHVTCPKEAGRRFHSLQTHVLSKRYVDSIAVIERMKSGRIHFHLLVVLPDDIRTGFNFVEAGEGVYSSASLRLRAEWSFWRRTSKQYGFGRTELLPVKSTGEAIAKYVGKYIAKHIGQREWRDKGVRLVRYSRGASVNGTRFMFQSPRSKLWRHQVSLFAGANRCADESALAEKFGSRWAWWKRSEIMALQPTDPELGGIFEGDRQELAAKMGNAFGVSQRDAYVSMFQRDCPWFQSGFAVQVPFVEWPSKITTIEPTRAVKDAFDVYTVWN